MINYDEIKTFLHAYAAGCLDKDGIKAVNESIKSEGAYYLEELGEYQNLTAFLPVILQLEPPSPSIKDKVARKLYRIKERKKYVSAPTKERQAWARAVAGPVQQTGVLTEGKEENLLRPGFDTQIRGRKLGDLLREHMPEETVSPEREEPPHEEVPKFQPLPEIPLREEERFTPPKRKKNTGLLIALLIFIIAAGALAAAYYFLDQEVQSYRREIFKIRSELIVLNQQLSRKSEVEKLFDSKNVSVINLTGTDLSPDSYGKFIVSFELNKGYLQLANLPPLSSESIYQLWLNTAGNHFSLGIFLPKEGVDYFQLSELYYPLTQSPAMSKQQRTTLIVTQEPLTGSSKPSGRVFLEGNLY